MSQNLFPKGLCCSLAIVATDPSPDAQFSLYLQLHMNFQGGKNFVSLLCLLWISYLRPVILIIKSKRT